MLGKLSQNTFIAMEWGRPYLLQPAANEPEQGFVVRVRQQDAPGSAPHPVAGSVVGYGNACTHMGCLLVSTAQAGDPGGWYASPTNGGSEGKERLVCGPCPCHGTTFDLLQGGLVVLGPATQNLPRIELAIVNEELVGQRFLDQDPRHENWPGERA